MYDRSEWKSTVAEPRLFIAQRLLRKNEHTVVEQCLANSCDDLRFELYGQIQTRHAGPDGPLRRANLHSRLCHRPTSQTLNALRRAPTGSPLGRNSWPTKPVYPDRRMASITGG